MLYRSIVAFDHAKQVIRIVSLDVGEPEASGVNASSRNAEIRALLEQPLTNWPSTHAGGSENATGVPTSNWSRPDFENAVLEIKELINAGECYQAVLSQCFTRETTASPIGIYRALRSLNPSPYMFLL